jgi:glycosyltransferase involved in cell wall biosynthesis
MSSTKTKLMIAVTKSNWGGAQRYVYDIAKHFKDAKGFDVIVIGGGDGDLFYKLQSENIKTISLSSLQRDVSLLKELKTSFLFLKTILHEKPDVLHLNSSKIGLFGAILGRIAGVGCIIFTAHAWPFNETRPKYQKVIFRILGMLTVFFAHRTIAVSESVIKTLRAPRFISKKMSCIYTGIDEPKLFPRHYFFEKYNLEKRSGVHIVSIGELHVSKGIDRALIALAQCKHLEWTYHIIGTGEKKVYLEELTKKLGLGGRVILHGFVEDASLPIIASDAGGIPEVLFDDPYTRLIDCNDGKIFKETLLSALKKLPVVDESKRPGRLRFQPKFMYTALKKTYFS